MPNSQKRIIKVSQGGKTVYEGEDKRFYNQDYKQLKCALGIPIFEWIKGGIWVVGIIIVVVQAGAAIKTLQEEQIEQGIINKRFMQYIETADSWNSSIYGTRFNGGAPVDGAFKKNEGFITKGGK